MKEKDLSRRAFLGLGASAAVVAGAGLAACAPKGAETTTTGSGSTTGSNAGTNSGAASGPSFMTPPPVPTDIKEEKTCDVLVIGLGLAGCAAIKAAAETGASVIGIEKSDVLMGVTMAGDFGVVGSKIQKDLGIEWEDKGTVVGQLMKDMCYRPTPAVLNYWYDHSGEDFDWFVEGADFEVLTSTAADQQTDKPNYIRPKCFPPLPGYDWKTEFYPYFHGTITTNPNMQWALDAAAGAATAAGAELIFSCWGEQLIVDNNKVVGAYVHDATGAYTKITAKAVVISTGDFGNNQEMRDYYIPWANEFACYYTTVDSTGKPTDTGDGHQMAMWAGGHMELGPLAPMTHHMGGPLGVDSYLQLNLNGERFMNEDIPGQPIADQLSRQPASSNPEEAAKGLKSWQIFDSKWPEQIANMPDGHGYTTYFISEEEKPNYSTVLAGFGLGYTTQEMVDGATTGGGGFICNTLDELIASMGIPADAAKASIERYNELCKKGHDDDFGKDSRRLFALENPPFYAAPFASAGMLVVMGGIHVNEKLQPLNDDNQPIEGLYMAGNTQGGRYLVEYPVTVAGISLSTALTFGRMAGLNATGADLSV